ncbi:MAG: hypothetical protein HY017_08620 [Betaproteobacteria bacterium]|nr:hypothetical protein [Betaproteobacteria bacterium]
MMLRKAELAVVYIGVLISLIPVGWASRDAFQANMAWTKGFERVIAFTATLASLLFVGTLVVAPYVLFAKLGKRIASDGSGRSYQIAGLVFSCLVTAASAYFYLEAVDAVSRPRASSTSAIVFVIVPVILLVVGGAAYGILVMLHAQSRKGGGA